MNPDKLFDVIVVGAGPAGCAAAFDLCTRGHRVALLDRHEFPRPKVCAAGLTTKTVQALRYDITPVVHTRCTTMAIGRGFAEPVRAHSRSPVVVMSQRESLDDWCLRQTREHGAEFIRVPRLQALTEEDDGVTLAFEDGTLRARYVVGADGANSRVRRLIAEGDDWFRAGVGIEAPIPIPIEDPATLQFDFGVIVGGYGWIFPKHDHLNVGLFSASQGAEVHQRRLASYVSKRLDAQLEPESVRAGALGMGGEDYRPRHQRVVLVGDAAGLVDALTGEGIFNAIRSGQIAAQALDAGLTGRGDARAAFAEGLLPLQEDLIYCAKWQRRLEQRFDFWSTLMTTRLVSNALLQGYAMGLPVSEIRSRWLRVLLGMMVGGVRCRGSRYRCRPLPRPRQRRPPN